MPAKKLDALEQTALTAMKAKAAELKVTGVAVASYAPGETVEEVDIKDGRCWPHDRPSGYRWPG